VEALLPETYDQAKQLVLIIEAQMKGTKKKEKNIVSNRDNDVDTLDHCDEAEVVKDKSMIFEY
ncbi:720_t:CDS:2, partial [Gigaspora margarita]